MHCANAEKRRAAGAREATEKCWCVGCGVGCLFAWLVESFCCLVVCVLAWLSVCWLFACWLACFHFLGLLCWLVCCFVRLIVCFVWFLVRLFLIVLALQYAFLHNSRRWPSDQVLRHRGNYSLARIIELIRAPSKGGPSSPDSPASALLVQEGSLRVSGVSWTGGFYQPLKPRSKKQGSAS